MRSNDRVLSSEDIQKSCLKSKSRRITPRIPTPVASEFWWESSAFYCRWSPLPRTVRTLRRSFTAPNRTINGATIKPRRSARTPAKSALTLLTTLGSDPAKTEAPARKLEAARAKYAADAERIQEDARAKDDETKTEERRALRFDIGEGLLELGLVLCSLYFLARKAFFPVFGVLSSIAGTAMGVGGFSAVKRRHSARFLFALAVPLAPGRPPAAAAAVQPQRCREWRRARTIYWRWRWFATTR